MIHITLSSGDPIALKPSLANKFRGIKIPGSALYKAEGPGYAIIVHEFIHPLYNLSLRQFQFADHRQIVSTESNSWLRMEIPLSGVLSVVTQDHPAWRITPGYYHMTRHSTFASDFKAGTSLVYFTAAFSPQLLSAIGTDHRFDEMIPSQVPRDLHEMVYDILKCPFLETFRNFYYANKVRELLFSHTVSQPMPVPGELSNAQVAAMYEADRIMSANLDGRITIPDLARMLGTNFVTLKRNYEKVFGVGIFPKLMQRKMDHIKLLLEKTDKPLKEIADLAGYQTLPGFINAFRKRFKVTPKEWRKMRRAGGEEEGE